MLDVARDLFLGTPEEMSLSEPVPNPNEPGRLIGGTAFERCGQNPVKGSGRCYSLTMTHQRQRALVGPTAGLKQYEIIEDDDLSSLNLDIRGKVTKVRRTGTPELILIFLLSVQCPHGHDGAQTWCTKRLYAASPRTCGHGQLASSWY